MDLVNEEYCLAAELEALLGGRNHLTNARDTFRHGGKRYEFAVCVVRYESSDRGLSRSRRPPEDHRRNRAALDRFTKWLPRIEEVVLADQLVERLWPHPRGKRLGRRRWREERLLAG